MSDNVKRAFRRIKFAITPFLSAMGFLGIFRNFTDLSLDKQIIYTLALFVIITYATIFLTLLAMEREISSERAAQMELNREIDTLNRENAEMKSNLSYSRIKLVKSESNILHIIIERREWIRNNQLLSIFEDAEDTTEPICIIKIVSFTHLRNGPGFPVGSVVREFDPIKVSEMLRSSRVSENYVVSSVVGGNEYGLL